jgi:NADH-quinone oxidoreductase subunit C
MAVKLAPHVPRTAPNDGVIDAAKAALGDAILETKDHVGEIILTVKRDEIVNALKALRDTPGLEYQQLMEIAGVDYPERAERFDVVYCLLSLTRNRRIQVRVTTDEQTPVPSVTGLWPVAGWLEREVFDMYGVGFSGNSDLRRILTDYGFEGHPQRKDFPLTGHVEMRYSEAEKRVVYEPVALPQDFRTFDFLMPWEGPEYVLPGDEKAVPEQAGAPSPAPAGAGKQPENVKTPVKSDRTSEKPGEGGGGKPADDAGQKEALKSSAEKAAKEVSKPGDQPEPKPASRGRRRPGGGTA